ncbi:hypothetical protein ACTGJ9_011890 [Bradyrhizobium sp. RDM12]
MAKKIVSATDLAWIVLEELMKEGVRPQGLESFPIATVGASSLRREVGKTCRKVIWSELRPSKRDFDPFTVWRPSLASIDPREFAEALACGRGIGFRRRLFGGERAEA